MSALEVADLTAAYGPVVALDGITFSVPAGGVTAVLGANGAGKTTLLRTISGLVRPLRGTVRLGGTDLLRTPVEEMTRAGVAHVPEGRGVVTELTVDENLHLGALGAPTTGGERRFDLDRVRGLFPVLGDRRQQVAHTLSGGERQMLVIARALLAEPKVLLLDEPSLGLAPRVVAQIFALLRGLVDEDGLTVVLVEQNARSALSIADTALVLGLGRLVADGDADQIAGDDRLRRAYLGK